MAMRRRNSEHRRNRHQTTPPLHITHCKSNTYERERNYSGIFENFFTWTAFVQVTVADPLPAQPVLTIEPNPIRRRQPYKSKITGLPPDLRTFLNQFLYDNVSYGEIIERLKVKGHAGFNRPNITRWVRSGYRDWLLEKERLQALSEKMGNPDDWLKEFESLGLAGCKRLNSHMLAVQMTQAMRDFDPAALTRRLHAEPELFFKFGRIINAQSLEQQRQQKIDIHVKQHKLDKVIGPNELARRSVKDAFNLPNSWFNSPLGPNPGSSHS
jgi:hypothetical protein